MRTHEGAELLPRVLVPARSPLRQEQGTCHRGRATNLTTEHYSERHLKLAASSSYRIGVNSALTDTFRSVPDRLSEHFSASRMCILRTTAMSIQIKDLKKWSGTCISRTASGGRGSRVSNTVERFVSM